MLGSFGKILFPSDLSRKILASSRKCFSDGFGWLTMYAVNILNSFLVPTSRDGSLTPIFRAMSWRSPFNVGSGSPSWRNLWSSKVGQCQLTQSSSQVQIPRSFCALHTHEHCKCHRCQFECNQSSEAGCGQSHGRLSNGCSHVCAVRTLTPKVRLQPSSSDGCSPLELSPEAKCRWEAHVWTNMSGRSERDWHLWAPQTPHSKLVPPASKQILWVLCSNICLSQGHLGWQHGPRKYFCMLSCWWCAHLYVNSPLLTIKIEMLHQIGFRLYVSFCKQYSSYISLEMLIVLLVHDSCSVDYMAQHQPSHGTAKPKWQNLPFMQEISTGMILLITVIIEHKAHLL